MESRVFARGSVKPTSNMDFYRPDSISTFATGRYMSKTTFFIDTTELGILATRSYLQVEQPLFVMKLHPRKGILRSKYSINVTVLSLVVLM